MDRIARNALKQVDKELEVLKAQRLIIAVMAPLDRERREQLLRFLMSAVENDCLMLVKGHK